MGIVLNYCQYGVLYLGSYYNTGPYIQFPHFGNSNLGKLPYVAVPQVSCRTRNSKSIVGSASARVVEVVECRVEGFALQVHGPFSRL